MMRLAGNPTAAILVAASLALALLTGCARPTPPAAQSAGSANAVSAAVKGALPPKVLTNGKTVRLPGPNRALAPEKAWTADYTPPVWPKGYEPPLEIVIDAPAPPEGVLGPSPPITPKVERRRPADSSP